MIFKHLLEVQKKASAGSSITPINYFALFPGLTTNVQMSSADQTTTQMATITVPPTGVPGMYKLNCLFTFCQPFVYL